MSQSELYRQVARHTGEDPRRLRRMSFRLVAARGRRQTGKCRTQPPQQEANPETMHGAARSD